MPAVEFDSVRKTYPAAEGEAVAGVSLRIPDGGLAVIVGPSGCGKTTLLKMVNRLVEPTAGRVLLGGEDVREQDVISLRRKIGYVIQQVGLFPHLTVARNISVTCELLGWPRRQIDERVIELLDLVHLAPDTAARYPAQLSGGQQQRVGIARALAADPALLLMDEPFGSIDAITRASLQEQLLELHARLGKTTLFVTHDVDEALRLADLLVVMRAGKVVQAGTPTEVLSQPAGEFVSDLLGTRDVLRRLGRTRLDRVMSALTGPVRAGEPALESHAPVRTALGLFLDNRCERIIVMDGGQVVGQIRWEDLKAA